MRFTQKFQRPALLGITALVSLVLQLFIVYVWANQTNVELYATFISITTSINLIGAINKPALNTLSEKYGSFNDYGRLAGVLKLRAKFSLWLIPFFIIVLLITNKFDVSFVLISVLAFIITSLKGLILSFCVGLRNTFYYVYTFLTPQIVLLGLVFMFHSSLEIAHLPYIIVIMNIPPFFLFLNGLYQVKALNLSDEDHIFDKSVSKSFSLNIILKADRIIIRYFLGDLAVVFYQICMSCMQVFTAIQNFIVKLMTPLVVAHRKVQNKIITSFKKMSFVYFLSMFAVIILIGMHWDKLYLLYFPDYQEVSKIAYSFVVISIMWLPAGLYFNFSRLRGDYMTVNTYTYLNIGSKVVGLLTCNIFGLTGVALSFVLSATLTSTYIYYRNDRDLTCIS